MLYLLIALSYYACPLSSVIETSRYLAILHLKACLTLLEGLTGKRNVQNILALSRFLRKSITVETRNVGSTVKVH